MTDQDNEIRTTDMPERFQVCLSVNDFDVKCVDALLLHPYSDHIGS